MKESGSDGSQRTDSVLIQSPSIFVKSGHYLKKFELKFEGSQ